MINCLIIDDEPFARNELAELLLQAGDINVLGQCGNAIEAMQQITKLKPQLLFLDINMPKVNGMELIAMLDPELMPRVVFVTAYDEYAIKAFELHAFDYLLKPIDENRLQQTLIKLRRDLTPQALTEITPQYLTQIPCYSGNRLKIITTVDVEYSFSDLGGVHVVTANDKAHTQLTLKVLEEKTPMIRCHRQYLITPAAISEIELLETGAEITTISGEKVPVSRRFLKPLKQLLGFQ